MDDDDDDDGQLIFGDLGGLKLSDICLTGEENPEKISPRKLVPTGDQTRARCMTGVHATAWPTAVDYTDIKICYKTDKFAFKGKKSKVVCRTVLTLKNGLHFKKV